MSIKNLVEPGILNEVSMQNVPQSATRVEVLYQNMALSDMLILLGYVTPLLSFDSVLIRTSL